MAIYIGDTLVNVDMGINPDIGTTFEITASTLFRLAGIDLDSLGYEKLVVNAPSGIASGQGGYLFSTTNIKEIEVNATSIANIEYLCFNSGDIQRLKFNTTSGTIGVSGFLRGFCQNCSSLVSIEGASINAANSTNNSNMLYNCPLLESVSFAANSIKASASSFGSSSRLNDASIVSIANGLNESVTGKSLSLHATPKARCSTLMGTVALDETQTYHVFTADASGTVTLADFITSTKGWTLA